jgi:hypothetical protein
MLDDGSKLSLAFALLSALFALKAVWPRSMAAGAPQAAK